MAMAWHDVQQNTDEPCPCCGKTWMELRAGRITGSAIAAVMAWHDKPLKGGQPKWGDPARRLAVEIAVVELGGQPTQKDFSNYHMQRGHEQEASARALYEETNFLTVGNGGFYEDGRMGCSPDGIIQGPDGRLEGLIEIKSVVNHVHHETIQARSYDAAYHWQVHYNLMVAHLFYIDFISYCQTYVPDQKLFVHRLHNANCLPVFDAINARLKQFYALIENEKKSIMHAR